MAKANIHIRAMRREDWEQVRGIYLEGLATGHATFETTAPSWERWDATHRKFARLVAIADEDRVSGWAALSPVSSRAVYSGVAEISVYVGAESRGAGVGGALLAALISEAEANGIWTLQAGIFPENTASLALHERSGFRKIGTRKRIAKLNGVWRDTVLLERRSQTVGVD